MANEPLWLLDHVSLGPARLRDVSLELRTGVTAVLGWSGAGKTSLLNVLAGFERPGSGSITRKPAGSIAWVPQNFGLWPHCTAREHLETVRPGSAAVLSAFDLDTVKDARPHELSQGEQSRLAVARAIAANASVLVMDEPLAHIDPARVGRYWEALRDHIVATGSSLVFATHQPETVLGEAARVVCLADGRVLHCGEVHALYNDPPTAALMGFLGPGNWIEPQIAARWLGETFDRPRGVRPERLGITPDSAGPFTVKSTRFQSSVAETSLLDDENATCTFHHRPATPPTPGARVRLTMLLALFAMLILSGCTPADGPKLTLREWKTIALPSEGASLPTPRSVACGNDGEIAVLDTAGRVIVYGADGALRRQWHMLDVKVGKPEGLVVLKDGRIVVCDTHYHRVVWFDHDGNWLKNIGNHGEADGDFIYPVGICTDSSENLYVCEYGGHDRIQKFTREGKWLASFGSFGTGPGQFQRPSGLAWLAGRVYVADAVNNRVLIYSDAGTYIGLLGENGHPLAFNLPYDIAAASDGTLYMVEYGAGRLSHISPAGRMLGQLGKSGGGEGEFGTPWGLAIGADMHIHIADTKNRRLVSLRLSN